MVLPPADDPQEAARLRALHQLQLLDTAPQREFDDLVNLASALCDTPIALVTLIDADRQWVMAKTGVDVCETARDVSFCTHAIQHTSLFVVPDLTQDPRFADNPFVTGEPHLRFYAGAPLVTPEGFALGTLCVLDTVPRALAPGQAGALEALGRQAAALLELRRSVLRSERNMAERASAQAELRASEERLRLALASVGMAIWDWDTRDNSFTCSEDFAPVFGHAADGWTPTRESVFSCIHPDDRPAAAEALRVAEAEGRGYSIELRFFRPDGSLRWMASTTEVYRDTEDRPVRLVGVIQDITARKKAEEALRESETALQRRNSQLLAQQEATLDGLLVVDEDRRIVSFNRSFCELWGVPDDLIERRDDRAVLTHAVAQVSDPDGFLARVHHLYDHPYESTREECLLKDGRIFERSSAPVTAASGKDNGRVWHFRDITERKRAEEAVRTSREMLRLIMDNIPQSIFWKDVNSVYLGCNRNFARDAGLASPDEIIGKTDYEMPWTEAESDAYRADDRAVMQSGLAKPNIIETQRQADGRMTWMETGKIPIKGSAGDVIGVLGTYEDITYRLESEDALRRSEQLLRTVVTGAPVILFALDRDGVFTLSEGKGLQALGLGAGDAVGACAYDMYRDNTNAIADLQRALAGESFHCSTQIGGLTFDNWYSPIRDAQGEVAGMVGVSCDVSQRAQAEHDLRSSEARFNAFMDNCPAIAFVKDELGRFVYGNRGFEEAQGATREQYLGRTALELMPSKIGAKFHEQSLEALRHEKAYDVQFQKPTPSGMQTSHVYSFIFRDSAGKKFQGILSLDVTQQKEAEKKVWEALHEREEAWIYAEQQAELLQGQTAELLQARDLALASTRAKSDFLANMSHEIRTPMNGILGMTGLLTRTPLSPQQQHYAETIRHSADALLTIINDILDFSKIEAGKMTIEAVSFDLREAMEGTVELLAPRAQEKGIALACVVPPGFPRHLEGDCGRVRQVLTNLIGNAIKFTPSGEVVLEARVLEETPSDARLRLSVRDTGVGIPPERQSVIFDSFTQADGGITRQYGGTGLGLTICRQLVTLMGGEIGVESEPGCGSTFWVTLPFAKDTEHAPDEAATPNQFAGLRVLVADGHRAGREALCAQLQSWGCHAEQAADGLDCLEAMIGGIAGGQPFGMALMDAQMLHTAGDGLAARLLQSARRGGTRTTLLGCTQPPPDLQGQDVECLSKPIRQSSLFNVLLPCIGQSGQYPQSDGGEHAAPGEEAVLAGMHVLLAEDNEINQEVAVATLEMWGCRVDVVGNGREALAALGRQTYDAVLMDVQMPEMDGLEATARIRRGEQNTGRRQPIIAMTAHNMRGDRENCLAAGMDDYASKPIDTAQLLAALEQWRPAASPPVASPPVASPPVGAAAVLDVPDAAAVLDFDSLHRICSGKVSLERRILGEFLRLLPSALERIEASVLEGAPDPVRFESHTLKGSSRTLGATALADACAALEDAAKAGDLTAADTLAARIRAEAVRLRPVIEAALEDDHWKAAA